MSHATHFLKRLKRVDADAQQLALALYREGAAVRGVLDALAIPRSEPRVALGLDDEGDGAVLVVARDGAFVTCLAPGMFFGAHPKIARAQLLRELARQQQRERLAATSPGDLLAALLGAGARLSPELVDHALALRPVFFGTLLQHAAELAGMSMERRALLGQLAVWPTEHVLDEWRGAWAIGVFSLLAGAELEPWPRLVSQDDAAVAWLPTSFARQTGLVLPFALACAGAARCGPAFWRAAKSTARVADSPLRRDALACMACTAARHRKLQGEARKLLEREGRRHDDAFALALAAALASPTQAPLASELASWGGTFTSGPGVGAVLLQAEQQAPEALATLLLWAARAELDELVATLRTAAGDEPRWIESFAGWLPSLVAAGAVSE